jgi:hypothetical protein
MTLAILHDGGQAGNDWRWMHKFHMFAAKRSAGTGMCLLCEELWMPFDLPPEAKARPFVADAPEPDPPQASPTQPGPADETADPPSS